MPEDEDDESIADLMVRGVLCQECGASFSDEDWPDAEDMASGHPRYCRSCGGDPGCNGTTKIKEKK